MPARRGSRNPSLQIAITHARHVCSQLGLDFHWSRAFGPASYPDVSLLMKMFAQRKAGRRQRACCLYPSHGPLRFISRLLLRMHGTYVASLAWTSTDHEHLDLPRTQTSLFWWKCSRKGRREGDNGPAVCTLPMVPCGSSPVTRFALASAMRKTKRLRRRLHLDLLSLVIW